MLSNGTESLKNLVIYEVFVRNHGEKGTFAEVEADLERIRSMGVDVVWLMPIHPIGRVARKGALGSPYSIVDYGTVNPEYGTEADFKAVIERAHSLGLRVMIDVVYNHTAHDSVLLAEHPEWYHEDESGRAVTTVPEWSDVIDLQYPNLELERYLIESLLRWSRMGVDGFRCDVASLVPVEFWIRARTEVARERPNTLWLAESVHASFVGARREAGLRAHSDGELYAAFDLEYDYDIWAAWQAAVIGRIPVRRYLELLRLQQSLYPENAVKMRCVENHDQRRIMSFAPTRDAALSWTAFQAFNTGAFLIYAGQEAAAENTPSLFDRDPIQWGSYELQGFLTKLSRMKKETVISNGTFYVVSAEPVIVAVRESHHDCLLGVFNVTGSSGVFETGLRDGDYEELLSGRQVRVAGGEMELPSSASIIRVHPQAGPRSRRGWFSTDLLDFQLPPNRSGNLP